MNDDIQQRIEQADDRINVLTVAVSQLAQTVEIIGKKVDVLANYLNDMQEKEDTDV